MPSQSHFSRSGRLFPYVIGLVAPLVSAAATSLLWPWLQPAVSLLFFPAVMIAALYGGLTAGLLATGVSVVLAAFFYIPPIYSFSIGVDDFARLVIFSMGAAVTATLSSARERAEHKQRDANLQLQSALEELTQLSEQLERRVAARTSDLEASNLALQREIEERARLSEQLVRVQEAERRRLARELHDQVGQALTALKLMLEAMMRMPPGVLHDVKEAIELVDVLMIQIRELSLNLRPSVLDDLGLVPALLWHVERFTAQTSVQVRFTQTGLTERLPADLETAAFRIVQEALTNVARHARVKEADVWLRRSGEELCVIVEDLGRGFDSEAMTPGRSNGLSGMRERVTLLGGDFRLQAIPDLGTRITVVFPLQRAVPAGV